MQPFRDLLKPGMWYWDEVLDHAFEDSNAAIVGMVCDTHLNSTIPPASVLTSPKRDSASRYYRNTADAQC